MKFLGYPRTDGSVGTRNYIGIIPSIFCANRVARDIGDHIPDAVVLTHNLGCGQHGADLEQTIRTLVGLGRHPNLAAVLVVSLGCEKISPRELAAGIAGIGKPVEVISIQECGGTINAVQQGTRIVSGWASTLFSQQREEIDIGYLVVGLKCGGTDATSGISANPALGWASDRIVGQGGTAILSELTELIGAEHVLAARAGDGRIGGEILRVVEKAETGLREKTRGIDRVCAQGALVTTGNFDGGVSTVAEKALGGMYKSGNAPFSGVVGYGERPPARGLYLMDAPGVDHEVVTGMVAGGANVVVFTTGRGTPSGFPFVPVIKVTGNSKTYRRMTENMDINAGAIIDGEKTLDEVGEEIFAEIVRVASGKRTKAEILKHDELFSIQRLF